ncbi:MAG: zinc ribbon domain-containing protein [Clostridia bacterium]|nr:zinc ribbon domain-containing protein [Clostridia bacterium]
MKCDVCGCENKENALFCAECGKALKNDPITLDLQEIKVPASSRKAHIVKVSTKKGAADTQGAQSEEKKEENVVLFNPEKAAIKKAEQEAQSAQEKAKAEQEEESSEFIPLQTIPENSAENEAEQAQTAADDSTTAPMKIKNWIPVFILSAIPVVNLIMLFVWSFSSRTNKSKQSFARLCLICTLIFVVLAVIAAIVMQTVFHVNFSTLLQGVKL